MNHIIGIDLGTTNSVVSILEGKDPKVIQNEEGGRLTPSVVAWSDDNTTLVGDIAKRQAVTNPQNTVFSVKRLMGRSFDEVKDEVKNFPYKIVKSLNGDAYIDIKGKTYSPQEISANILKKLKASAEAYLGVNVNQAVITVPAYFNDRQRQATKDAGSIAGLEVLRIINEPTAASLAYGLNRQNKGEIVAVYDFGGGTFDISLLEISEEIIEVLATNGDTHLGGDDIDQLIINYLIEEFYKDEKLDLKTDVMALQRLKEASEKAKIELSSLIETTINLPFISATAAGPKHLKMKLSRAKLESMIEPLIEKTIACCNQVLKDINKRADEINQIIMVGGITRIPKVQEKISKFFGKELNKSINPDEVVAQGAAVQGGILGGTMKELLLLDVTPLSLGVETKGGIMSVMIPRNTTIPTKKSQVYTTVVDNQKSVEIHVLQGERKLVADNRSLGRFSLDDLPSAPRGGITIEVTFDIDANGIVNVSAVDKISNKQQKISILPSGGLSKEDIERLIQDANEKKSNDEEKKIILSLKNKLEQLIYSCENLLNNDINEKDSLLKELENSKNVLINNNDKESIENAHKALESIYVKFNNRIEEINRAKEEEEKNKEQTEQEQTEQEKNKSSGDDEESQKDSKVENVDQSVPN